VRLCFLLATVTFLSPLSGTQAVGVLPIEITTNAANLDRVDFFVDGALAGVARKPPYRIAHDFGTSLAAHQVSAKVFSNGYKSTDGAAITTASLGAGEVLNVDLVEVPLRVRASRRLVAGDLRVNENDVAQSISELRSDRGPARFVFVVDRSLSMDRGKLAATFHAIDEITKLLRADDRVEVVVFNHNVGRPRPIARGEKTQEIFHDITPSGGTSLRDAVSSIVSPDRTYAIVITDGGDRNSMISESDALQKISGTRVVLDALVFGERSSFLERAAANTGGEEIRVSEPRVESSLRHVIADINSRYTAVYQSHGTARGWRTIHITAARRGVSIVNARSGYFAE
jgi:Mg-chelatase subunit ChlD